VVTTLVVHYGTHALLLSHYRFARMRGTVMERTALDFAKSSGTVVSKLKCPLFLASEMSGFGLTIFI
jgi:hypothetical protein